MTDKVRTRSAIVATLAVLVVSAAGCASVENDEVRGYVDEALAVLDDGYYAGSEVWDDAVQEALPDLYAASSTRDTYGTLSRLTKVAGGTHSFFSTPADVAGWELQASSDNLQTPTVTYGSSVATVTIPAFSSDDNEATDRYLKAATEIFGSDEASSACGWVIDLRTNTGGSLWTMLVAVSPLLDNGVVETFRERDDSTSEVTVEGNTVTWKGDEWGSLPGDRAKLTQRPIAIVQSSATASAAESVILAFAGQAGVATFGAETGGFTTVNNGHDLADGSQITLSFALMGDRAGNFPEGPIPPDHELNPTDGSARDAAQTWAARQCVE